MLANPSVSVFHASAKMTPAEYASIVGSPAVLLFAPAIYRDAVNSCLPHDTRGLIPARHIQEDGVRTFLLTTLYPPYHPVRILRRGDQSQGGRGQTHEWRREGRHRGRQRLRRSKRDFVPQNLREPLSAFCLIGVLTRYVDFLVTCVARVAP